MELADLESAFMQAHKAGDAANAAVLASEIERRRFIGRSAPNPDIARKAASEAYAGGRKMDDVSTFGKFSGGMNHGTRVVGSAIQDVLPKGASDWLDEKVWDGKRKETLNNGAAFVKEAGLAGSIGSGLAEAVPSIAASFTPLKWAHKAGAMATSLGAQALTAALTTPGDVMDRSMAGALSMGGEALGRALPKAISRLAQPVQKLTPDTQLLVDNGIYPTLGGALGPAAKTAEDKLMSIPLIGDAVAHARRGAILEENAWLANRSGIPKKITAQDYLRNPREVQAKVGEHLDEAYAKGTEGLMFNPNTAQFKDSLNNIVRDRRLTTSGMDDYNSLYGHMRRDYQLPPSQIDGAIPPSATGAPQLTNANPQPPQILDGKAIQQWGRDWRTRGSAYQKSLSAGEVPTGQAMNDSRFAMLDEIDRQGIGASTDGLRLANRQWADSQVLRDAADATGSVKNSGVASPGTILTNFKKHAEDGNYGRAFREGRAPGENVAEAANRVLGNNYPDSGSAGRWSIAGLLAGGQLLNPVTSTLGLVSAATSSTAGRKYLVGKQGEWQTPLAEALRKLSPVSGKLGAGLATGLNTNNQARYREEQ